MNRKDVRAIAARLNNPILLLALERHSYHGISWEEAINGAVVELAKQNDYFLQQLVDTKLQTDEPNSPAKRKPRAARDGVVIEDPLMSKIA